MTTSIAPWLRRLAAPRRPQPPGRAGRRSVALLLRLTCVGLLAWIGAVHLHLWLEGYRQIPTDGPLFLLDAVTGLALAALLLVWAAPLAGLAAAGYTAATLGALLISLAVGLSGFLESISASFVTQSLATETITVLALLGWTALVTASRRDRLPVRRRSPAPHEPGAGSRWRFRSRATVARTNRSWPQRPDPAAQSERMMRGRWARVNCVVLQHREGRLYPVHLTLMPSTEWPHRQDRRTA